MSISKTFIGYHKHCGGRVFRESMSNSLFEHTFCSACRQDTAKGNFNIAVDVVSDLTSSFVGVPGGDLMLTDEEYKVAYQAFIDRANASQLPATNFLETILASLYNGEHSINSYLGAYNLFLNGLGATIKSAHDKIEEDQVLLNKAGDSATNTDGTISPPDSVNSVSTYFWNAKPERSSLLDSTGNEMGWASSFRLNDVDYNVPVLRTDDAASVYNVVDSADFTTPHAINDVYLIIGTAPADSTVSGEVLDDWTRGTTVAFSVSVNGGGTFTNSKWVDSTIVDEGRDYKVAHVFFETPGSVFKWRMSVPDDNRPMGIINVSATLKDVPVTQFTEYDYSRFV